ncbi:hypothetical protein BS78_01G167900 [Paspalum vaginatum]|nr:hypothetical protein BS78_01G167900 [Paspalum vaginatum]
MAQIDRHPARPPATGGGFGQGSGSTGPASLQHGEEWLAIQYSSSSRGKSDQASDIGGAGCRVRVIRQPPWKHQHQLRSTVLHLPNPISTIWQFPFWHSLMFRHGTKVQAKRTDHTPLFSPVPWKSKNPSQFMI